MIDLPENIRNIAVVGHQGSGKTTLVESLAYKAGVLRTKGSVEDGSTLSDYLPEEKKKQSSMQAAVVPLVYMDHKLNLIDLPGNDDYLYETIGITRLVKGAVLVVDASKGVQIGTVKSFRLLRKRGVPVFIYLNKMDKENVDYQEIFDELCTKLDDKRIVPFTYPIGRKENFDGFVNVVELKARKYNGKTCEDDVIYDDKKPIIYQLHNRLCEAVATTDDAMLDRFFSGDPFTNEEIKQGLRTGVLAGELYPVIVGSALKDIGINTLLTMLIDYLPSPSDLKPVTAYDPEGNEIEVRTCNEGPVTLQIFKNYYNPYQGMISMFKVMSGKLTFNKELYCPNNGKTYKLTSLFTPIGNRLNPVQEIGAGDIGATNRLDGITLSDTLCEKDHVLTFRKVNYPTPVYFKGIVPESKKDSDKLFPAAARLMAENPTISLVKDEITGQILIGGLGRTHLEEITNRLKNDYQIAFHLEAPKISYRETITAKAEAEGRYIKQSGGSGYYGVVLMSFEPAEETGFESQVFGGHIDKGYFPAVEKGFREALRHGGLIQAPVIRVHAILKDGKQHSVDSNEVAFENAAIDSFRKAYDACHPVLLEPYDRIVVNVGEEYLGAVLSDLTKRRGRIQTTEERDDGTLDIVAVVPQKAILEYADELKAITKGTGFFNREMEDYHEVLKEDVDGIIQSHRK
jgi:elongation factor G